MHREGLGSFMWPTMKITQLDGYTDGLMLNTSYTESDDGIRDILLDTKVKVRDINPMESFYEVIALENKDYQMDTYGRYWTDIRLSGGRFCASFIMGRSGRLTWRCSWL